MSIEQTPFRRYNTSEDRPDIFTIRLNKLEREQLNKAKIILEQPKDSTTIKLLTLIGYYVLQDNLTGHLHLR